MQINKAKFIHKITIIISIIILISVLFAKNVQAVVTIAGEKYGEYNWEKHMPEYAYSVSGLFPQKDDNLGGWFLCDKLGGAVSFGKWDKNTYFFGDENFTYTYSTNFIGRTLARDADFGIYMLNEGKAPPDYLPYPGIQNFFQSYNKGSLDTGHKFYLGSTINDGNNYTIQLRTLVLGLIKLNAYTKISDLMGFNIANSGTGNDEGDSTTAGTGILNEGKRAIGKLTIPKDGGFVGPAIWVMESDEWTGDGYTQFGPAGAGSIRNYGGILGGIIGNEWSDEETQNAAVRYVLSSYADSKYNLGYIRYTPSDMQGAYWIETNNETKISEHSSHITDNARTLATRAEDYQKFVAETEISKEGYESTESAKEKYEQKTAISTDNVQVFVDRNEKYFTVGPFTITYPDYQDISYINKLKLTTVNESGTVTELIYDETHSDFEITIEKPAAKSNNLIKQYPASGSKFWVKFSAEKTEFPRYLYLDAEFEFVRTAEASYSQYTAECNAYRYAAYISENPEDKYAMNMGSAKYANVILSSQEYKNYFNLLETASNLAGIPIIGPELAAIPAAAAAALWASWEFRSKVYEYDMWQPYVLMERDATIDLDPQLIVQVYGAMRQYDTFKTEEAWEKVTTPEIPKFFGSIVDLTIEFKGTVWVDNQEGKKSEYDGKYGEGDTPMSGVTVKLYQVEEGETTNGKLVAITKTDKNGEYKFDDQNAMYQYYIGFTYNGQYYQPTIFNNDIEDDNAKFNSYGLDIRSQRDEFNAKFEEIGSHPNNVKNSIESDTRENLENDGKIDEFGNPTSGDAYVNECMLESFTCDGTNEKTLYPSPEIFVTDDALNMMNRTINCYMLVGTSDIKPLYGNPNYTQYINQGYVLRETADLALTVDVYKAYVEIKDRVEEYTYDKRQIKVDLNENLWEISVRNTDVLYNIGYSRELYKEDYYYQIDDYNRPEFGENNTAEGLQITPGPELEVYVQYKIRVRNQSTSIATEITEIVDHFDSTYTLMTLGKYAPYLGDSSGMMIQPVIAGFSKYQSSSIIPGYQKVYLSGFNTRLEPNNNKDMYVYVTFKVNKKIEDGKRLVITGEKQNIAEVNGYKTYYGKYVEAQAPNRNNSKTEAEYVQGDIAGILDVDSTPGNTTSMIQSTFEDDTDKAPGILITLNEENLRTINGVVWEDERNLTSSSAQIGNGEKEDEEIGVNGVTVQLIELFDNENGDAPKEFIWAEMKTGDTTPQKAVIENASEEQTISNIADGAYEFKGLVPGNYIIKYIYGDGTETVVGTKSTNYETGETQDNPVLEMLDGQTIQIDEETQTFKKGNVNSDGYNASEGLNIGLNENSYTGQDYKSTIYKADNNSENVAVGGWKLDYKTMNGTYSQAKDIWELRQQLNDKYKNNVTNNTAEMLASMERISNYSNIGDNNALIASNYQLLVDLINNTQMTAVTGWMDIGVEYKSNKNGNSYNTNILGQNNIDTTNDSSVGGYFTISNVNFGLVERAKAQLKLTKQVSNVKVILADGSTLFDASGRVTNVMWIPKTMHKQDTTNSYSIKNNYDNYLMKIPSVRTSENGRIQLTMDEEVMHGATIKITYVISVANIGEVDYADAQFYYTGQESNPSANIVKTKADTLIDYVGTVLTDDSNATRNNIQFIASENPDWEAISLDDLINSGLVNEQLKENIATYTTIIKTREESNIEKELIPIILDESNSKNISKQSSTEEIMNAINASSSVAGVKLVLSQVITIGDKADDKTYNNLAEIVSTSNTVGRRMSYSVVGNQDPTKEPYEIDADIGQEVVILPPFGQNYIYYILGIAIAVILIAGLVIVIRVTKKK